MDGDFCDDDNRIPSTLNPHHAWQGSIFVYKICLGLYLNWNGKKYTGFMDFNFSFQYKKGFRRAMVLEGSLLPIGWLFVVQVPFAIATTTIYLYISHDSKVPFWLFFCTLFVECFAFTKKKRGFPSYIS